MEKYPLHIKNPELHISEEVLDAVGREERRSESRNKELLEKSQEGPLEREKLPNDPSVRIEAYMNRLEKVFLNPDQRVRERNLERLRPAIYDTFVIKPENVPEQAFLLEQKIAREMGHGDIEITDEFRQKKTEQIINDQKHSLDLWIDYLSSEDATYPTWSKYLAFTSMTKMGGLKKNIDDETGKENAVFKKRTKETVASFPPLNARALAMTISVITEQLKRDGSNIQNTSTKLSNEEFKKLAQSENFSKIYAQFLIELPEYSTEGLKEIRGKWIKYDRGSDPTPLVKSLEGYPLEWCTANPDTAKSHLEGGDFYVYYSLDQDGKPVIPRLTIRMQEKSIAEDPRGIAPNQNLDPYIAPVLEEKLKEFGEEGERYKKKSADMKVLTLLEQKVERKELLTKSDLLFLYEIDSTIEGFGYQKDPRVEEIRKNRNKAEDMKTFFECSKDQIAEKPEEVNENTVAYLGPWNIEVFKTLKHYSNIKYPYESFPDKKIFFQTIETTVTSKEDAKEKIEREGMFVSSFVDDLLRETVFSEEGKEYEVVRFSVAQLGLPNNSTTDQIYAKAKKQGLYICPAEVGPNLRLAIKSRDYMLIAMEQIIGRAGAPDVFRLSYDDAGLMLNAHDAHPERRWPRDYEFVFLSRKP